MNNTIKFLVDQNNNGMRLDIFLSKNIKELTRSYIKKLIKNNQVLLNSSKYSEPSTIIRHKDEIIVEISKEDKIKLKPENIPLDILYEDKDIIVINKIKGMVVHPGAGNKNKTLVNALLFRYKNKLSDLNGTLRPGIVHRIDKETSGILVVAKNNLSHANLGVQFSKHTVKRKYLCLVWGVVRPLKGKINTLITRDKKNRQ